MVFDFLQELLGPKVLDNIITCCKSILAVIRELRHVHAGSFVYCDHLV